VLGPLRPLERALTRNSESSKSSAFSAENIWQVCYLYKRVAGPKPSKDATKLGDLVEKLAADNALLQAQISGL
jgi:hypothetical protein